MRVVVVVALMVLCACAHQKLALVPPHGVDFSGQWRLNDAESDDPLRLLQSQTPDPSKVTAGGQGGGGQGGGRGGRQGGRGGGGAFGPGGPQGPVMPGVGALGAGLRWPGKEVDIKQVGGVVAMTSGGVNRVYQPVSLDDKPHHHPRPDADGPRMRDMPDRDRDAGAPARCGWEDKTLVIKGSEADDDHQPFEERYTTSDDGQRLIEVVGFKGGRSNGFTMSRVWDRVPLVSRAANAK